MDGKKSFRGKTGIALLVAGVIAISGVGASLAGTAYAADATAAAGEVVINPATDSTTTEYNAYQIFKADIGSACSVPDEIVPDSEILRGSNPATERNCRCKNSTPEYGGNCSHNTLRHKNRDNLS